MQVSYADHVVAVCDIKKQIKGMDSATKAMALNKVIDFLDNRDSNYLYDIRFMLNDLINDISD